MMEGKAQLNKLESKGTSDEAESPPEQATAIATDHHVDTAGTGRSYECIFCKRGFSTAQALGGHMNIHRRDRARATKSSSAASSKRPPEDEDYGHYHHPYPVHRPQSTSSFSSPRVDPEYYPKSSGGYLPDHERSGRSINEDDDPRRPRELGLFGQELQLGLGLHGDDGNKVVEGGEEKRGDEEEELDLELRLGHDRTN